MSDDDLVRYFQEFKDRDSFGELYRRHHDYVLRISRRLLDRHSCEAEDMAQAIWVILWKKLDTFMFGSKLETWVFAVAQNASRAYFRSGNVAKRVELDEGILSLLGVHHDSPLVECLTEEMNQAITAAIGKLDERFRSVIMLSIQGYSYKEISALLNIKMGTMMSRLHRARELLWAVYFELRKAG